MRTCPRCHAACPGRGIETLTVEQIAAFRTASFEVVTIPEDGSEGEETRVEEEAGEDAPAPSAVAMDAPEARDVADSPASERVAEETPGSEAAGSGETVEDDSTCEAADAAAFRAEALERLSESEETKSAEEIEHELSEEIRRLRVPFPHMTDDGNITLKGSIASMVSLHRCKKSIADVGTRIASVKQTIDDDERTYADNVDILMNYEDKRTQLEAKLAESTDTSEQADTTLVTLQGELDEVSCLLEKMREEHLVAIEPFARSLDEAKRSESQQREVVEAKEHRLQSDYGIAGNITHSMLNGTAPSKGDYEVRKRDLGYAQELLRRAENVRKDVQATYDVQAGAFDDEEAPHVSRISDLQAQIEEQRDVIATHSEIIGQARARLEHCEQVHAHPEQTDALQQAILDNEARTRALHEGLGQLEQESEQLHADAGKARLLIVGIVAAVVLAVVIVCSLSLG